MKKALLLLWLALALSACHEEADSPAALDGHLEKSALEGEWQMRQVVVEGGGQAFALPGLQGEGRRVRFVIEESQLVVREALAQDTLGAVVASYPIAHRDLSDAHRGQERHWTRRGSVALLEGQQIWSPSGALHLLGQGIPSPNTSLKVQQSCLDDGRWGSCGAGELDLLSTWDGFALASSEACEAAFGEARCGAQTLTIQTSFLRVTPDIEEYERKLLGEDERFGFLTRPCEDLSCQGESLVLRRRLWSRWAIDLDGDGQINDGDHVRPFEERKPEAVVYYLNPGFPVELIPTALEVVDAYDQVLTNLVRRAGQQSFDAHPMVALCANTGERDEERALWEAEEDAKLAKGEAARLWLRLSQGYDDGWCQARGVEKSLGDPRYSFIAWMDGVANEEVLSFTGITSDSLSGEIVVSDALIYGDALDAWVEESLHLASLFSTMNEPTYAAELVRFGLVDPELAPFSSRSNKASSYEIEVLSQEYSRLTELVSRIRSPEVSARLDKGLAPFLLQGDPMGGRWAQAEVAGLGALASLFGDGAASSLPAREGMAQSEPLLRALGPHRLVLRRFLEVGQTKAALGAMRGVDKIEDAEARERALRTALRQTILSTLLMQGLGHSLGLSENLAGSYDALNYAPDFWKRRDQSAEASKSLGCELCPTQCVGEVCPCPRIPSLALTDPACPTRPSIQEDEQRGVWDFGYASVMDLGASPGAFGQGLGLYDEAALHNLYGDLVEVFELGALPLKISLSLNGGEVASGPVASEVVVSDFSDLDLISDEVSEDAFSGGLDWWHYSALTLLFGEGGLGLPRLYRRAFLADDPLVLQDRLVVPYRYCSYAEIGASPDCAPWDRGADSLESARSLVQGYASYQLSASQRVITSERDLAERRAWLERLSAHYRHGLLYILVYGEGERLWARSAFGGARALLGGEVGLRLLLEEITRPAPGLYLDEEGRYIHQREGEEGELLESSWRTSPRGLQEDAELGAGLRRAAFSLLVATDFEASAPRVGEVKIKAGYPTIYGDPLTRFLGALIAQDHAGFAPVVNQVTLAESGDLSLALEPRDPLASSEQQQAYANPARYLPLLPYPEDEGWTSRLDRGFALYFGLTYFPVSQEERLNQTSEVEVLTPEALAAIYADTDGDGLVDLEEGYTRDTDGDGIYDFLEEDADHDQVADSEDNCLAYPNPLQEDLDEDGVGDACQCIPDWEGCVATNNPSWLSPLPTLLTFEDPFAMRLYGAWEESHLYPVAQEVLSRAQSALEAYQEGGSRAPLEDHLWTLEQLAAFSEIF